MRELTLAISMTISYGLMSSLSTLLFLLWPYTEYGLNFVTRGGNESLRTR